MGPGDLSLVAWRVAGQSPAFLLSDGKFVKGDTHAGYTLNAPSDSLDNRFDKWIGSDFSKSMKIALSTLKRYIHVNASVEELSEVLTGLGFEIEGIEKKGYSAQGPVLVGQIVKKGKHPNADRLTVCKVSIGRENCLTIVCGATNFKEGDFVPVALPGAQVGDSVLKKTRVRDVDSEGMLCSEKELGLSNEGEGLLLLNNDDQAAPLGSSVADLFQDRQEVVFDLSVTSNRGDCLSYRGIARELSAWYNLPVEYPPVVPLETSHASTSHTIYNVELLSEECPYYTALIIKNVQVGPSPEWLKGELEKVGLRSINNLVDITNFVLLELGQPLHMFDLNKIEGTLLSVRSSEEKESLTTLDGKNNCLPRGILLVADAKKPLAIAGVMGGENSEVDLRTTDVLLESAYFNPESVRRATRTLGIQSDSAYRFERNVDPWGVQKAALRALSLVRETSPNATCAQCIEVGDLPKKRRSLSVDPSVLRSFFGFDIPKQIIRSNLERLGFEVEEQADVSWRIGIPSFRQDIVQAVDLAEEVLRLHGTHRIPSKIPDGRPCLLEDSLSHRLRTRHADILSAHGFFECYTDSLQPTKTYETLLRKEELKALKVVNPLSQDHVQLRFSLLPGLLQVIEDNQNQGNQQDRFFESGRVFREMNGSVCELFSTACIVGCSEKRSWRKVEKPDYYFIQALVSSLLQSSGLPEESIQAATENALSSFWQPHYAGKLGDWNLKGWEASLGYLNLSFVKPWLKEGVFLAAECLWLPERIQLKENKRFRPFSEWPMVQKDLSLLVPSDSLAEEVRRHVEKATQKSLLAPVLLRGISIFDVYEMPDVGKKSLAFCISFGSNSGTLTDAAVNSIFENLQARLENDYTYQIRKQTV